MTVVFNQKTVFNMKNSYIFNVSLYSKLFSNPDFPNLNKNLEKQITISSKSNRCKNALPFCNFGQDSLEINCLFCFEHFFSLWYLELPVKYKSFDTTIIQLYPKKIIFRNQNQLSPPPFGFDHFFCLVRAWSNSKI